jgi:hypothetical protein
MCVLYIIHIVGWAVTFANAVVSCFRKSRKPFGVTVVAFGKVFLTNEETPHVIDCIFFLLS